VTRLRDGAGPQFVELSTYRWREHCGPLYDNDIGYRTVEEFEAWRQRDPIELFRGVLQQEGTVDAPWMTATEAALRTEVAAAFAFADSSPVPPAGDAFAHVYGRGT
jgi:pyruvate dehydrogenase E1 component alpha subunit